MRQQQSVFSWIGLAPNSVYSERVATLDTHGERSLTRALRASSGAPTQLADTRLVTTRDARDRPGLRRQTVRAARLAGAAGPCGLEVRHWLSRRVHSHRLFFDDGHPMFNASKLLQSLLQNNTARGVAGGLAGGLLLSRGGRQLAGSALKLGGLAAIGAMAYRAYENNKASKALDHELTRSGARVRSSMDELELPPENSGFLPAATDHDAQHRLGLVLVRAMIAAARSDGRLDAQETAHILAGLDTHEFSQQERAELRLELARPVDIDELVAAGSTPPIAAEIYIAARGAINPDTAAERAWLAMLAARLGLDAGLVAELESALAD